METIAFQLWAWDTCYKQPKWVPVIIAINTGNRHSLKPKTVLRLVAERLNIGENGKPKTCIIPVSKGYPKSRPKS